MTKSNSHAKVPVAYYVDTMKELELCPKLLQIDYGTETVLMAAIQSRLQASVYAHRYSSSAANIRIENWWSYNRKGYTVWLINFFKDMVAAGEFNLGNTLHMKLASYTFSPLLQHELDQVGGTPTILEEQDMILSLEGQTSCSLYQNYLEVKTKEQILVIQR